jgi:hypothetical protein
MKNCRNISPAADTFSENNHNLLHLTDLPKLLVDTTVFQTILVNLATPSVS